MKKCFKCGRELPFSEFYRHPQMGDGYLGKCKECTKSDSEARRIDKMKDPDWVVAEAERCRLKQAKRRRLGLAGFTPEQIATRRKKYRASHPDKHKAHTAVNNAVRDGKITRKPCEVCGSADSEAHHDDYSKPLDVIWLCPKHHAERHVKLRDALRREKALASA